MSRLKDLTKAISSGVAMLRVDIRNVLPSLYILNKKESTEDTELVYDGDYPNIYPQAYGEYLDMLGGMFDIVRHNAETDEELRSRILFFLSENSTKAGIQRAVQQMFLARGFSVDVDVRENFNHFFDGTSSTFNTPMRSVKGTLLYGLTIVITANVETLNQVVKYDSSTGSKETIIFPTGVTWRKRRNPYIRSLVDAFKVTSLEYLLSDIVAAGISVDKVIVQTVGTSGNLAPVTAISQVPITETDTTSDIDMTNVLTFDGLPLVYDGEFLVYS